MTTKDSQNLNHLRPGHRGRIHSVDCDSGTAQRLMSMGVLPGRELTLAKVAPLGDPIAVDIAGHRLSLRRAEAKLIHIEPI